MRSGPAARRVAAPRSAVLLIHDDGPAKADIAVVLAGDQWGNRMLKAAELVRAGLRAGASWSAGRRLLRHSRVRRWRSTWQSAAAIRRSGSSPLPNDALSTREEAAVVLDELRRRNVHSFLLVTSDYHTARAAPHLSRDRARDGRRPGIPDGRRARQVLPARLAGGAPARACKIVFMEWSKTIATAVGI